MHFMFYIGENKLTFTLISVLQLFSGEIAVGIFHCLLKSSSPFLSPFFKRRVNIKVFQYLLACSPTYNCHPVLWDLSFPSSTMESENVPFLKVVQRPTRYKGILKKKRVIFAHTAFTASNKEDELQKSFLII